MPDIAFELKGIRVVEHASPLFLLGADIMRGGRAVGWNFAGIRATTVGPAQVQGSLEFQEMDREERSRSAPLVYCPAVGTERFSSTMLGTMAGGQVSMVIGGGEPSPAAPQCVQRVSTRAHSGQVMEVVCKF